MNPILYHIILVITAIGIIVFLNEWFIPWVQVKYTFYKLGRVVKKMAKKYDGDTKDKLNEIADGLRNIAKEEEL